MEPVLLYTGASADTIGYATDYLSIYLAGTVFVQLSVGLNTFINTQGRPGIAMLSTLIGAVMNIVLDPVFIFVLDMGVKGAAGHVDMGRVKECFRVAVTIMFSFNAVLMLLMIIFPDVVATAFTDDPELIGCVDRMMPFFLSGMVIFGLQRACQNTFIALGQARISLFIALLRKVILLVPLAIILPRFWGVTGVFAAESIADATAAICCVCIFAAAFPKILGKTGAWQDKKEDRLKNNPEPA